MTGGPYIKAHYDTSNPGSDVVNIKNGSIVGYKYFNFDLGKGTRDKDIMAVNLIPKGKDGTIKIMLDRPWERDGGTEIGSIEISATDDPEGVLKTAEIDSLSSIEGKHALYFVFKSSGSSVLCDLNSFQFGDSTVTYEDEGQDVKPEESPAPDETPLPTPTPVPGNTAHQRFHHQQFHQRRISQRHHWQWEKCIRLETLHTKLPKLILTEKERFFW